MSATFRESLLAALDRTKRSIASVAAQSGVSEEQLKKLIQREGARTNVDDAVKVARAFGMTLDEFLDDELAQDRLEIATIYSELSEPERRLLRATARGLAAPGQDSSD